MPSKDSKYRSVLEFLSNQWDRIAGKNQAPWDDSWQLDLKFFREMEAWETAHPESTLAKVLEKVNGAVTLCKPFISHIPDSPFPARSLVQGLACLLQLGMAISSAKKDIYNFTTQVSTWFYAVETALRGGKIKKFSGQAKKNLSVIRDLINEICKWGWARLNDGRWASFVNGFTISGEIQAFKEKLTEARELLSVMQDVNVAVALDDIMTEILAIKRFTKCQLSQIMDYLKEKDLVKQRRRELDETLNPEIALRRTAYDDQGKLPCDTDTRLEILADITNWVNDVSSQSQNFFWMTGDPGCGKSAIAASIARHCKDEGSLWAQFFINRNNEATTNPRVYFPSIAHQMASHSSNPTVSKKISNILKEKPSLLDGMTNDQALTLFVKVIQAACDVEKSRSVVIVIDGLDETSRKSLEDTATIFSGLFKELHRPNAKVFISSRTDNEITKPFFSSLRSNHKHVRHVHLDTSDPSSMEDVSRYLSRKIGKLAKEENLSSEIWPGRERFERLCVRAAGLFIWAVTVTKFFEEQVRLHGPECLDVILEAITAEEMEDVNKLYQTILAITYRSSAQSDLNAWAHETFRWVVGFIIGLKEPLSIGDVGALLELRRTSESHPIDIVRFVTNLRSVLVTGTGEITNDTIPRLHKSFVEFITSDKADDGFHIDLDVIDMEISRKCLELLKKLGDRDDASRITGSVRYSIRNWTRHLATDKIRSGVAILGDEEAFSRVFTSAAALKQGNISVSGDYRTHMYDPGEDFPPPTPFYFSHSSTIEVGDVVYAVVVSMDGRMIASGSRRRDIQILDSTSHVRIGELLRGHSDIVRSLCFSPDSRWLVSGSHDRSIRVWNCQTLQAAGSPLWGHTAGVVSVCTDGRLIVSGGFDQTIRIWDLNTGEHIGEPINAGRVVYAVVLSNNGRIVAGVGKDICVWDVKTRDRLSSMTGHTSDVYSVALSPDNSRIASGSDDGSIRLWDAQTYIQVGKFAGHRGDVLSISFSHDGRWIVSGSRDDTIRVWNSNTGQLIVPPLQGHTDSVRSVAFTPDNHQLISGSRDTTIHVWSKSDYTQWPKRSEQITSIKLSQSVGYSAPHTISLAGNPSVIAACYSPDHTLYAASTLDGHLSLWHIKRGLLWDTDISMHPIHLLRLSMDRLILSSPDGSLCTWDLVDGKPTRQTATFSGPQIETRIQSNPTVQWIPFAVDAGLWAYIDGTFLRFDNTGGRSVTLIDLGDVLTPAKRLHLASVRSRRCGSRPITVAIFRYLLSILTTFCVVVLLMSALK